MNRPQDEVYIQIDGETETTAFCLRRMETITDGDCQVCFEVHEQLQAGYRSRVRCTELHWVEIAEFFPLPSALGSRTRDTLDPVPCPAISHPSQNRHP